MKKEIEMCVAVVTYPMSSPYYMLQHACEHKAKETVGGLSVCGIHARVAKAWQAEAPGRLELMAGLYWDRSKMREAPSY